ncbi:MAG: BglG family transcription antiterminator LicT [Sarcina sp.]
MADYQIQKILNNNVVLSTDLKSKKELILMGCGIAFKKKVGDQIDSNLIEKKFKIEDKAVGDKIKTLISKIPNGIFQLAQDIIIKSEEELAIKLDKQIYISLADHLAFAIKRSKEGIVIKNPLLHEIKVVHKKEYELGIWSLEHIAKKAKIFLPDDEIGFIALHIVNASYKYGVKESQIVTSIINDVLEEIVDYFKITLNENDINYDRLLTHLKFFAKRIISEQEGIESEISFLEIIKNSYSKSYRCAMQIKKSIKKKYNYEINSDEIVYLSMHIERVIRAIEIK